MDLLGISLISSITLCSLVSGFIFTYSIVVMPGLSNLNDKDFLKAFQVTDAVIQNNQPLFMFTWIGSILAVLATILISVFSVGLAETWLIVLVGVAYLLGVQGITAAIHIPLNNQIQKVLIEELNDEAIKDERVAREIKTTFASKYHKHISLEQALQPDIIRAYAAQSTGKKYLITPHKD